MILDAWRWIKTKHSRAWRCFAIDCLAPRPITKRAKDWTHKAAVSPPSSPEIMKCVSTSSNRCAKIFRCADAPRFSISKALCNWLFCHFSWAASAAETFQKKSVTEKDFSHCNHVRLSSLYVARCRALLMWNTYSVLACLACHLSGKMPPRNFSCSTFFPFQPMAEGAPLATRRANVRLLVEKKLLREMLDLYLAHIQHQKMDSPNLSRVGKSLEKKPCKNLFWRKRKD